MTVIGAGMRFGRLVTTGSRIPGTRKVEVVCDCGVTKLVLTYHLTGGRSTSCGCYRRELLIERTTTHGYCSFTSYIVWKNMLERCYQSWHKSYHNYGGRGIYVCDRWHEFENFLADMGEKPEGLSIDRIDNDGIYEPGNCRWATASVQTLNRRPIQLKAHCRRGHLFPEDGPRESNGARICPPCLEIRKERRRQRREEVKAC